MAEAAVNNDGWLRTENQISFHYDEISSNSFLVPLKAPRESKKYLSLARSIHLGYWMQIDLCAAGMLTSRCIQGLSEDQVELRAILKYFQLGKRPESFGEREVHHLVLLRTTLVQETSPSLMKERFPLNFDCHFRRCKSLGVSSTAALEHS